jgi:GT2 family glycosyltransferase
VLSVHREHHRIALNPNWVYPPELVTSLHRTAFGRFLEKHAMTTFRGWYADSSWKSDALFASRSVASFHLSMRREDFAASRGYDEQFPHAGFEDYDFPRRLAKIGLGYFIDTRITVYHNESDRLTVRNWVQNQERRAFTRAVAVRRGYAELALHYPPAKQGLLSLLLTGRPLWLGLLNWLPELAGLDAMKFRIIGVLQAASIYKGYSAGLKS